MQYQIPKEMYMAAFRLHYFQYLKRILSVIAILLCMSFVMYIMDNRYWISLLIGAVIGAPIGITISYALNRSVFLKTYYENEEIKDYINIEVSAGELVISTKNSKSSIPRHYIKKVRSNKAITLLYRTRALFHIIPTEMVNNSADLQKYINGKAV